MGWPGKMGNRKVAFLGGNFRHEKENNLALADMGKGKTKKEWSRSIIVKTGERVSSPLEKTSLETQ